MNNAKNVSSPRAGKVYLVGAGPGDPKLLTLKAARVLAGADVVFVDDLVNRALLEHVRRGARIVEVGKRGGCKSTSQAFIERAMLAAARHGETVVRLKGGDPFLFGRGGEEWQTMRSHGVAVEVVSGVTAGVAAPAAIGMAVTHRDCAPGVAFVTGHSAGERAPDWRALARSGLTLVIYMGVARLADIVAALLDAGMRSDTPAAAIENATLPQQRRFACTLAELPEVARRGALASPAIVVVGECAAAAALAPNAAGEERRYAAQAARAMPSTLAAASRRAVRRPSSTTG